MVIEIVSTVQFLSEIILVISNWTRAATSRLTPLFCLLDSSNNIIHEPGLEHKENLESTQAKIF